MGFIRTLTGDIEPEELGMTSVHEHTLASKGNMLHVFLPMLLSMKTMISAYGGDDVDEETARRKEVGLDEIPKMEMGNALSGGKMDKSNPASKLSDFDYYVNELKAFREIGGRSICDCSPSGMGAPFKTIAELSKASDVQIVGAAGYYIASSIPKKLLKGGEDALASHVRTLLQNGDGTCEARPGIVKCAISIVKDGEIAVEEQMAVRACAKVAKEEGYSLHIHTAFPVRKKNIMDLAVQLEQEIGINPSRVVFLHMDSYNIGSGNPAAKINEDGYDIELPVFLASHGFNIGLDTWAVTMPTQEGVDYVIRARRKMLLDLIERGFEDCITLGHDFMKRNVGIQNHSSGYVRWPNNLREMKEAGLISAEAYEKLTVTNARKLLTIEK